MEDIEIFNTEEPVKKKRRKRKSLSKNDTVLTGRQINLLALNATEVQTGKITLAEATIKAGYCTTIKNAAATGVKELNKIEKKLSRNELFQEALGVKGATLDKAAEAISAALDAVKPVKVASNKVVDYPDHKVRLQAADMVANAFDVMPEKKVVTEHKSFETKVSLIADLKANPEEGIAMIQKLLGQRQPIPVKGEVE